MIEATIVLKETNRTKEGLYKCIILGETKYVLRKRICFYNPSLRMITESVLQNEYESFVIKSERGS